MTDPISSIGGRLGIGGMNGVGGTYDIASRLADLRQAMQHGVGQGNVAVGGVQGGVQGGDSANRYQVDIGKENGPSFGDTLTRLINQTSDAQDHATNAVDRFVRGEPVELHQVMAATEEAGIALEVLVELRNKLTDTYRTLITMQS